MYSVDIQSYEHFSFDLWLTIIKSHPEFKMNRNRLLKEHFLIREDIEKVADVVRYYDVLCNEISQKTGNHIDMKQIVLLIVNNLAGSLEEITDEQVSNFYIAMEDLLLNYKPRLIDERIYDLLQNIQNQGKTMNIASNTAFIYGRTLRKVLNYYNLSSFFTFEVYSDEIGYSKPSSYFFETVFEKIKTHKILDKNQIVHIGDNKVADYEGALRFGFRSILI